MASTDAGCGEEHHPDALHLPHTLILEEIDFAGFDKRNPVVVNCRSGGHDELTKEFLEAQGIIEVKKHGRY